VVFVDYEKMVKNLWKQVAEDMMAGNFQKAYTLEEALKKAMEEN